MVPATTDSSSVWVSLPVGARKIPDTLKYSLGVNVRLTWVSVRPEMSSCERDARPIVPLAQAPFTARESCSKRGAVAEKWRLRRRRFSMPSAADWSNE